jgi:hypothetical protein
VTAVIVMARSPKPRFVAEGVETEEELAFFGLTKFEKRLNRAHPRQKKHVIRWTVPELRDGLVRLVE